MPTPVVVEVHIYASNGMGPPLDPAYIVFQPLVTVPVGQAFYTFGLGALPGLPSTGARTVVANVQGSAVKKSAPFLLRG